MPVNRPQTRSRKKAEDTRNLGRIKGSRLSDRDIVILRQLIDAEKKKEKAPRNLGRIKGSRLSDRDIVQLHHLAMEPKKKATKTTRTKIKRK